MYAAVGGPVSEGGESKYYMYIADQVWKGGLSALVMNVFERPSSALI